MRIISNELPPTRLISASEGVNLTGVLVMLESLFFHGGTALKKELKTSEEWVEFIKSHDPEKITGISRLVDHNTWSTFVVLSYDGYVVEYHLGVAQNARNMVDPAYLSIFNKRIRSLDCLETRSVA